MKRFYSNGNINDKDNYSILISAISGQHFTTDIAISVTISYLQYFCSCNFQNLQMKSTS